MWLPNKSLIFGHLFREKRVVGNGQNYLILEWNLLKILALEIVKKMPRYGMLLFVPFVPTLSFHKCSSKFVLKNKGITLFLLVITLVYSETGSYNSVCYL